MAWQLTEEADFHWYLRSGLAAELPPVPPCERIANARGLDAHPGLVRRGLKGQDRSEIARGLRARAIHQTKPGPGPVEFRRWIRTGVVLERGGGHARRPSGPHGVDLLGGAIVETLTIELENEPLSPGGGAHSRQRHRKMNFRRLRRRAAEERLSHALRQFELIEQPARRGHRSRSPRPRSGGGIHQLLHVAAEERVESTAVTEQTSEVRERHIVRTTLGEGIAIGDNRDALLQYLTFVAVLEIVGRSGNDAALGLLADLSDQVADGRRQRRPLLLRDLRMPRRAGLDSASSGSLAPTDGPSALSCC